ncbi:RNA chaperone Hfq [Lautropia mirabilis]
MSGSDAAELNAESAAPEPVAQATTAAEEAAPSSRQSTSATAEEPSSDSSLLNQQFSTLNSLRRARTWVDVYLVTGTCLHGQIRSFDSNMLLLQTRSGDVALYHHAVSSVMRAQKRGGSAKASSRKPVRGNARPSTGRQADGMDQSRRPEGEGAPMRTAPASHRKPRASTCRDQPRGRRPHRGFAAHGIASRCGTAPACGTACRCGGRPSQARANHREARRRAVTPVRSLGADELSSPLSGSPRPCSVIATPFMSATMPMCSSTPSWWPSCATWP